MKNKKHQSDDSSKKDNLRQLWAIPMSRSLIVRMMLQRVAGAGFGTAITTLIAIQSHVAWFPSFSNIDSGMSGLAALGIISAFGGAGGLLANSLGHSLVKKRGVKLSFRIAASIQFLVVSLFAVAIVLWSLPALGIISLGLLTFVLSASSPGLSGLARAWWHEIGLSKTLAARGGSLEPSLAAIAWSVGPVIAAPLVLLTPWVIVALGGLTALGLILLSKFPTPLAPPKPILKTLVPIKTRSKNFVVDWWIAGSYSFYHIARSLLNAGSTAVLLGSGQSALIGAATAAPSIGHSIAGVAFAARKNPESKLKKAVLLGLLGQGAPTLLIALAFWFWPQPNIIIAILVVVGGGVLIGVLKAPVASAIYPLALVNRPQVTVGRNASRIANGMILGGLVGPLLGTLIIITLGATWLLPFSVLALIICAVGVMLDNKITR